MSLDELKQRIKEIPISQIIGNYVTLKKQGAGQISVCPFHSDTKPSMNVSDAKGIYKCFACGASGDSIRFVEKFCNLEFIDALKEICQIVGIPYEEYVKPKGESPKFEMSKKVLSKISQLYKKQGEVKGNEAFESFIKERHLKRETASEFAIGYAPKNNAVTNYLSSIPNEKERQFALNIACEIGLISPDKKRKGAYYDYFRERIMFPIWDQFGNVTGFSSRRVHDWQKAKYMNSKDSFAFRKGNILFGLNKAKGSIREKDAIIVVEGHMDLIVMHQHGFKNSVAIMGTAMTENSITVLKRFSKNFYLGLDTDNAGFDAAARIHPLLLKEGISPMFITYAPYKDPDELIQSEGPLEFQKRIDEARPLTDILLEKLIPEEIPELIDQKFELLKKMFTVVAPMGSHISATERLIGMAKRLGLHTPAQQIVDEYEKHIASQNKPKTAKHQRPAPQKKRVAPAQQAAPPMDEMPPMPEYFEGPPADYENHEEFQGVMPEAPAAPMPSAPRFEISKTENYLLKQLTLHPECLEREEMTEIVNNIDNSVIRGYVERLVGLFYEIADTEYPALLIDYVSGEDYPSEIKEIICSAAYDFKRTELNEKVLTRLLEDIKRNLRKDKIKNEITLLKNKRKLCTTQEENDQVLKQIGELQKKMREK